MNEKDLMFIKNNLHLTNNDLALQLNRSESEIRNFLYKRMLKRTPEQIAIIKYRIGAKQSGENNPNWKGGISKDNYHYKKIQIERYPEKIKARQSVYYHKKTGNIIPGSCEECGINEDITAHHPDYTKPLEVVWLCVNCHKELHRKEREQSGKQFRKLLQPFAQLNLFDNYHLGMQQ